MNYNHEIDTAAELKAIRKRLHRRSLSIILISVLLAAGILLGTIFVVMPAIEKSYWDPKESSYGSQFSEDLELTLAAYGELFTDDVNITSVWAERTGFASHNLTIQYSDTALGGDSLYTYGTLAKGNLSLPMDFMRTISSNIFERGSYPEYPLDEEVKESVRDRLEALPDYTRVYVAASFPEDLTMEELLHFQSTLKNGTIGWIGIRNSEVDKQRLPLCGMTPFSGGILWENINDSYPYFNIKGEERTAESLAQHFKSLLKYSIDRETEDKGVGREPVSYYNEVLEYVEENGVNCYGCYLAASPATVLELLDNGVINQAWPMDAWIDF